MLYGVSLCFLFTLLFRLEISAALERCASHDFQCQQTGECISKKYLCDGTSECTDYSDETTDLCKFRSCSRNLDYSGTSFDFLAVSTRTYFRCNYGACISSKFICNGVTDCIDNSDETHELCHQNRCRAGKFRCNYGACISRIRKCNGRRNCLDGSDETEEVCKHKRCRRNYFRCSYGGCIYGKRTCDGKADCADESDELPSVCGPNHKFKSRLTHIIISAPVTTVATTTVPPAYKPIIFDEPSSSGSSKFVNIIDLFLQSGEKDAEIILPKLFDIFEGKPKDNEKETTAIVVTTKPTTTTKSTAETNTTEGSSHCPVSECQCPRPFEFLCVPCDLESEIKFVCEKIGDDNVCSTLTGDHVIVELLNCGPGFMANVDMFSRNEIQCGSEFGVPVLTTVFAQCWKTTIMVLDCLPNGSWKTQNSEQPELMTEICQPETVNSNICGNFPFVSLGNLKIKEKPNPFPFLVGIFRSDIFSCTGTIIASQWILTAAHCIVKNFEDSEETWNATDFSIQYTLSNGTVDFLNVSSIHLSFNFTLHPKWTNDIALMRLENTITYSDKVFPVCLDVEGKLIGKPAATFVRKEGVSEYAWNLSVETLDVGCFNRERSCTKHLNVGQTEFCSSKSRKISLLSKIKQKTTTTSDLRPGSSGGPFLVNLGTQNEERWTVAGVVSHRLGTDQCSFSVYSYVQPHVEWITNCVNNFLC